MKHYKLYLQNTDGSVPKHQVHSSDCFHYNRLSKSVDLGMFGNSDLAVSTAREHGFKAAIPCPKCGLTANEGSQLKIPSVKMTGI